MAPKPFGKTGLKRWAIPRIARISLWILGLSPIAWLACYLPSRHYPVLDDSPLIFAALGFLSVLFFVAAFKTLRARPVPRPPGSGVPWAGPLFLGLALALPPAFAAAYLLEPAGILLNGAMGRDSRRKAWAMVERRNSRPVLVSPYWRDDERVDARRFVTGSPQSGDLATLDLGDGFLGMTWIRGVTIEELR